MNKRKMQLNLPVVFGASILFYLVFFLLDGVQMLSDSNSYIKSSYGREPLYPLFLMLMRSIIVGDAYLKVVVFFQCMVSAYATYRLTVVLWKRFSLDRFSTAIVMFLQFAVVLLCRMAAVRKATYCNGICSEGIAIPLFTLFLAEVFLFVWEGTYRSMVLCMIYAALLISTRKQMYIVLLIMGVAYVSLWIIRRIGIKKALISIASIGCALFLAIGMDLLYNLCLRGEAMRHTTDSSALVIMTIYSSSREDADAFTDPEMKALFSDIMTEVEEKEYNYKFSGGNFLEQYEHYSSHYDLIAFGVVNPHFYNYLDTHFMLSENERARKFDEINSIFLKTLLPNRWKQILTVAGSNMLVGLCNTFAKAHPVLAIYSFLFLVVYVILFFVCLHTQKTDLCLLSYISMASVLINVVVVGLMIFAQSRYMIYNMPFAYISMFLMVREVFLSIFTKCNLKKETA